MQCALSESTLYAFIYDVPAKRWEVPFEGHKQPLIKAKQLTQQPIPKFSFGALVFVFGLRGKCTGKAIQQTWRGEHLCFQEHVWGFLVATFR